MATVTPGPFASYHARREQDHRAAPKPTVSYLPPTKCMEEGIRAGGFLWLIWSSFRRKQGGMGAGYGRYGKSGGSSHRRSTNTLHPLPDPYPLKTIPLKCPDLVMLPLLGPLQPGSIRLQFRGCLTPIHANKDISPIKKGQSS